MHFVKGTEAVTELQTQAEKNTSNHRKKTVKWLEFKGGNLLKIRKSYLKKKKIEGKIVIDTCPWETW